MLDEAVLLADTVRQPFQVRMLPGGLLPPPALGALPLVPVTRAAPPGFAPAIILE